VVKKTSAGPRYSFRSRKYISSNKTAAPGQSNALEALAYGVLGGLTPVVVVTAQIYQGQKLKRGARASTVMPHD